MRIVSAALLLVAYSLSCQPARAAICPCGVEKEETGGGREYLKKRMPGDPKSATTATVAEIAAWPIPAPLHREDPPYGRENLPLRVHGRLQTAWINPNDCDFRLDVSDREGSPDNVLQVEIPNTPDYCDLRIKIIKALKTQSIDVPTTRTTTRLQYPPAVTVIGYPFLNRPRPTPRKSADTQTSTISNDRPAAAKPRWQIHPAFAVEWDTPTH